MKKRKSTKKLVLLFSILTLVLCTFTPISAYERSEHDKYMLEVLFNNFKVVENDNSIADKIAALESASYLCIDQFNESGQKDLDVLKNFGVKNLPSNINEISFNASGTTHRTYTHRGWDFDYGSTNDKWPIRKQILINTADKIFDFKGNEKQKESFCAIVYYIHILGDHMDDTSYLVKNGLKMDVGGRHDKIDIIHELEKHIEIVFPDQKHTHKYQFLLSSLEKYNSNLSKVVNSEGGINTEEKFEIKQSNAIKIKELLTYYLPEMLKDEEFFNKAFY